MKTLPSAALVCLLSGSVAAEERTYVSGVGDEYRATSNTNGTVLTSLYPKVRTTGTGAMTEYVTGIDVIYFGRSCDAYHEVFGNGTWGQANGGFLAEFDSISIGFPRQELIPTPNPECDL